MFIYFVNCQRVNNICRINRCIVHPVGFLVRMYRRLNIDECADAEGAGCRVPSGMKPVRRHLNVASFNKAPRDRDNCSPLRQSTCPPRRVVCFLLSFRYLLMLRDSCRGSPYPLLAFIDGPFTC